MNIEWYKIYSGYDVLEHNPYLNKYIPEKSIAEGREDRKKCSNLETVNTLSFLE
jgi:hypothetical protein